LTGKSELIRESRKEKGVVQAPGLPEDEEEQSTVEETKHPETLTAIKYAYQRYKGLGERKPGPALGNHHGPPAPHYAAS